MRTIANKKTHYETLEIDERATQQEIRKSYHKLAIKNHPDKQLSNDDLIEQKTNKFKEISEAYAVLSDEDKREEYDRKLRRFGGLGFNLGSHDDDHDAYDGDLYETEEHDLERRLFCARVGIRECVVRTIYLTMEELFNGSTFEEVVGVFKADYVHRRVVPALARVRVDVPVGARDGDTIYVRTHQEMMQRVAFVVLEKKHDVFSRSESIADDVLATISLTRKECEEGIVKEIKGLSGRVIKLRVPKDSVKKGKDMWHTVSNEGFYKSKPKIDVNDGSNNKNKNNSGDRMRGDLRVRFRQMSSFEAFWRKGSRLWWAKRIGGSIIAYAALELGLNVLMNSALKLLEISGKIPDQIFLESFPGTYGIIPSSSVIFGGHQAVEESLLSNILRVFTAPRGSMPDNIRSDPPPRRTSTSRS